MSLSLSSRSDSQVNRLRENHLVVPLRESFLLHLRRPIIPALVLSGSILIYFLRGVAGGSLEAEGLLSIVAFPPLDLYGDMTFLNPTLPAIGVVVIRISTIWLAMSLLVNARKKNPGLQALSAGRGGGSLPEGEADAPRRPPMWRTFPKFLAVYAVGFVVLLALLVGLNLAAKGALNSVAASGGFEGAADAAPALRVIGGVFFLLEDPVSLLLSVLFVSAAARAINGVPARPTLKSGRIWIYALLSWALWWVPSGPSDGLIAGGAVDYAAAFLAIFLQSVIYGAVVFSTGLPAATAGNGRTP